MSVYIGKCERGSISKHKIYEQSDMHVLKKSHPFQSVCSIL